MKPDLSLQLAQEPGLVRTSATFQEPEVRLSAWDADIPVLCVEEGGVSVELEFSDPEAFRRFQEQVAAIELPDDDQGGAHA